MNGKHSRIDIFGKLMSFKICSNHKLSEIGTIQSIDRTERGDNQGIHDIFIGVKVLGFWVWVKGWD